MGLATTIRNFLGIGIIAASMSCSSCECSDTRNPLPGIAGTPETWPDAGTPETDVSLPPPIARCHDQDKDQDGYFTGEDCLEQDCDDSNPDRFPGNTDICDHINNDCDNKVDEDGPCQKFVYAEWLEDFTSPITVRILGDNFNTRTFESDKYNGSPTWSRDAQRIAYFSAPASDKFGGKGNIFVMRADGKEVEQLTNKTAIYHSFAWSPDNKRLAFFSTMAQGGERQTMTRDLYVVDIETKQITRLTFHKEEEQWSCQSRLSWNKEGNKLVYSCVVGEQSVPDENGTVSGSGRKFGIIYDFATRKERKLMPSKSVESPIFSPDSDEIFFVAYRNRRNDVAVTDATGIPLRYVTKHKQDDHHVNVRNLIMSPDKRNLGYIKTVGRNEPFKSISDIFTVSRDDDDNEEPRQLTQHEDLFDVRRQINCNSLGWFGEENELLYTCTILDDRTLDPTRRRNLLKVHEGTLRLDYVAGPNGVISPDVAPYIPATVPAGETANNTP